MSGFRVGVTQRVTQVLVVPLMAGQYRQAHLRCSPEPLSLSLHRFEVTVHPGLQAKSVEMRDEAFQFVRADYPCCPQAVHSVAGVLTGAANLYAARECRVGADIDIAAVKAVAKIIFLNIENSFLFFGTTE